MTGVTALYSSSSSLEQCVMLACCSGEESLTLFILNRVAGNLPGETVSVKVDSVFFCFFESLNRIPRRVPSKWFTTFFLHSRTQNMLC